MSNSMNGPHGLVIGTAGHIDHGKTSLVRALTGIDTDRLAEEKKRGISIDLGFAHMSLPNGASVSFVDVPGHERFIKNMLAGACGIEAVMLVVAADEGVMPQTREHFEICRLLGVQRGFVVLTKLDLADAEQCQMARQSIADLCAGSFLQSASIIEASARTGLGLDDVVAELARVSERVTPRPVQGMARLPIDRSFVLKGFGTVVTGTLAQGSLSAGDTVVLHPANRRLRIRGLQVHGRQVERACMGQRTAVNLAGIEHGEIRRGDSITNATEYQSTRVLDVAIEWLPDERIPATGASLALYIGTAETSARIKILIGNGSAVLGATMAGRAAARLSGRSLHCENAITGAYDRRRQGSRRLSAAPTEP